MAYLRFLTFLFLASASAFAPVSRTFRSTPLQKTPEFYPQRQRQSVAPVQTMGLFGLGVPELAVIAIAAAFLLGPQKLAELGKDAGKIAGELKEVPKEFQKGLAEGESQAKAMTEAQSVDVEKEEKKE